MIIDFIFIFGIINNKPIHNNNYNCIVIFDTDYPSNNKPLIIIIMIITRKNYNNIDYNKWVPGFLYSNNVKSTIISHSLFNTPLWSM